MLQEVICTMIYDAKVCEHRFRSTFSKEFFVAKEQESYLKNFFLNLFRGIVAQFVLSHLSGVTVYFDTREAKTRIKRSLSGAMSLLIF